MPDLRTNELTKDTLCTAFGAYANTHSAASIRRCWSTWNTLCTFLFTAELLEANPMPVIGCPNARGHGFKPGPVERVISRNCDALASQSLSAAAALALCHG